MITLKTQTKKTMLYVASATLLLTATAAAQSAPPCNTGYKSGTGTCGTIWTTYNTEAGAPGERDAYWQLYTQAIPSNPSTAAQKKVIEDPCSASAKEFTHAYVDIPDGQSPGAVVYGYWLPDGSSYPNSDWISPINEVNDNGGLYIYKQTWTVPTTSGTSIPIMGRLLSDNETYSIYGVGNTAKGCQHLYGYKYNGTSFSGTSVNGPSDFYSPWTKFTGANLAVTPGSPATIYVIVRNRGVHGIDSNPTPTGLRLEFGSFPSLNLGQGTSVTLSGTLTDLAVVDSGSNKVAVYLNENGQFPKATEYIVGVNPSFVAAADLNGDGATDLAVANAASGTVSVLLNTKGTFGKALSFPAGANPAAIAIADLNGDGIPDMAIANAGTGNISILLGTGGGKFGAPTTVSVGDPNEVSPSAIAVADLNGDGIPDLALTDSGSGTIIVLLGAGDGKWMLPMTFATEAVQPNSIVVADFNGDGIPDLAFADAATGSVYVDLGVGGGAFGSAQAYPAGAAPQGLALNEVGGTFLAVANPASNMVTALTVNSSGTLGAPLGFAAGSIPVSVVPFVTASGPSVAAVDNGSSSIMVIPGL